MRLIKHISLLFLLLAAAHAFGQLSATVAGSYQNCTSPCTPVHGQVASFSTSPTYNQAAGHCIWFSYIQGPETSGPGTVSDTGGDSFTLVTNIDNLNSTWGQTYVAFNSHANAANAITVSFPTLSSYWIAATYYDISGPCNYVDVNSFFQASGTSDTSISDTVSTVLPNEIILTTGWNIFYASVPYSYITAITSPSGFTAGSLLAEDAESAYEVVTSRQSGLTITWSSVSPYITDIIVNSLGYNPPPTNRVAYY